MATKLTDKDSIFAILKEMSVEEKLLLLTGKTPFLAGGNEKYGIPSPLLIDGGTGFNTIQMHLEACFRAYESVYGVVKPETCVEPLSAFNAAVGIVSAAPCEESAPEQEKMQQRMKEIMNETRPENEILGCYPPGMFFGATMNPDVIFQSGEALGREAAACHVDVLLGTPNVNIHRDPRNGRLFEGYSEDPYLTSVLAPAFVKGVQSTGVAANVKHYAANNQETDRMGVNESISERAMREIYLPGFEACIKAGCKTIMSSYNSINGVPSAQNSWLLKAVLRGEWEFDGFVVSDWGAVYDRVAGQNAGNDVCMPGPRSIKDMLAAVEDGRLTEETIDEACANYLNVLLDLPVMKGRKYQAIDIGYSMDAAYAAAKEGITLLKNKDHVLPLSKTAGVAFYGERSKKFVDCGAGSAQVVTPVSTSMFESTVSMIGAENVSFEKIVDSTDYVVVTVGANGREGADRANMEIEASEKLILEKAISDAKKAGKPVILVLNISAPVELCDWIEDVDAILCVYLPGMAGGKAAADILFGDVNPSGKLPLTFPKHYADTPSYRNFPGINKKVAYAEDIYVGYRYYDLRGIEPQFPFGFGLSYTRFALSNLHVTPVADIDEGETVQVNIDIKNIGRMAGAEVVQLYISDPESTLEKPVKELKGIQKVYLEPGEKSTIEFTLCRKDFSSYDESYQSWTTEAGVYQILIGTSSRDIKVQGETRIFCENPYGLNETISVSEMVAEPAAMRILEKHLPEVNIMEALNIEIVFVPQATLKEVWSTRIAPLLKGTDEQKNALWEAIIDDFREVSRTGGFI